MRADETTADGAYRVVAFYKFVAIDDCADLAPRLKAAMLAGDVLGTVLLAPEGINGTISGRRASVDAIVDLLRAWPGLGDLACASSCAPAHVFNRAKVRIKPEIISLGAPVDPTRRVGAYVQPAQWNELISDPDVVLIDTRNDYEVFAGTFRGAIDPKIKRFRDLPGFVEKALDPGVHKKVAMFCTGGIRCEKSTAYLLGMGFESVFHLEGGILGYLAKVPKDESLWEGDCYVFDERVGVDHDLAPSDSARLCPGCGYPLTTKLRCAPAYIPGVRCPRCAPPEPGATV